MLKGKISPSLMCADITKIREVLDVFQKCEIDYLHIDVMDGVFVPNLMLSDTLMRQIRLHTEIPFDYHLMISSPEDKVDWFDIRQNDVMTIHYESTPHVQRTLAKIRARGGKAGIALNPATPLCNLEYLLDDIDLLLIMTVNPGFAGQKAVGSTFRKILEAREYLDQRGYEHVMLEVDGCVSFENATIMRKNGADVFVAGSSSIFRADYTLENGIAQLRKVIA